MSCGARAASSPRWSRLRAHDDPSGDFDVDAYRTRPDSAWVDDHEDALTFEIVEAGGVALVDGDLEAYRQHEANSDSD